MEGTFDAFTSGTIPGPRHAFPFKYYISKVGGGVSDPVLILLMHGGVGGSASPLNK